MTTITELVDGQTMSWAEYTAIGDEPRAEYVDGKLVMSPSPRRVHQTVSLNLSMALRAAAPATLAVVQAWSWKVGADEFIPDVMVHPRTDEDLRFTGTPVLAVEILSSNRSTDLITKTFKYAAAGLPHFWVVDPRDAMLHAYVLDAGAYRLEARITSDAPGELAAGAMTVTVDVAALLDG